MKKYTKLASTLLASMFVVAGLSSCGGGSGSKDTLEIEADNYSKNILIPDNVYNDFINNQFISE